MTTYTHSGFLDSLTAMMVGSTLNHYRITQSLGSGGMGEVYLAEDARLKRTVAIKILPSSLAAKLENRERFEREAQTVASLNHPNIVTVYSVEQAGDTHFLTMEYVEGRTLAELLPKHGLPLKRLLPIARQIAEAVSAAHDRGIVHRDLKLANVMVGPRDRVKVLDFGLAKLREAAAEERDNAPTRELTAEGKIVGTVAFMSPEQAEGKDVDERSDVFSLGVVLYMLLTGEPPFKGETSLSILSSIIRDTPRPVNELNLSVPRDFDRIIRHCLAKDPDRRYQSAKDLRNDLEELEVSLSSGELDAINRAAPVAHPRSVVLLTAATVAVAALTAAGVWIGKTLVRPAPLLPSATHTRLTLAPGIERFPNLSPDGKWVVFSKDGDIFLQSVTGQNAINLTNDPASMNSMPAFSPDGELIAFRSERAGGGLYVMGRTGDSVRRLTSSGFYPAWFPDGRRIIFSGHGPAGPESLSTTQSDLLSLDIAGSSDPRPIKSGPYAVQPRVSPHGLRIAYWGIANDDSPERNNRDIWTVDVNGKNTVRATTHPANDWNPVWSPDGRWLYFLSNRGGSMNLWRVAIDESTGRTTGDPQPLTAPAAYVSGFTLSADGRTGAYLSFVNTGNVARVGFDPATATTTGPAVSITTGGHDFSFGYQDVTRDGRWVAATTGLRSQEDLFLISTEDGTVRQMTNDFSRYRAPRLSSDQQRVLFYSDRGGEYAVWSIDADGAGLRQLTHGPFRGYPVPSRDGSKIAAEDIETHQLFIYDAHDMSKPAETAAPNTDPEVHNLVLTDWSPDGTKILYHVPNVLASVWTYSLPERKHRRLTAGISAAWLQDGKRFAFARRGRLYVFDTAQNDTREVLSLPGETINGPRLAVNDTQLFFVRSTADGDLWVVRFGDQPTGQAK